MSASDHIQPYQMKLFMTAGELFGIPSSDSSGFHSLANDAGLQNRKRYEAERGYAHESRIPLRQDSAEFNEKTLKQSIAEEGVKSPVELHFIPKSLTKKRGDGTRVMLANGNHRVVAAHDIDPNMYVPIEYHSAVADAYDKRNL